MHIIYPPLILGLVLITLSQHDFEPFILPLLLEVFGVHSLKCLIEGFAKFVCLVIKRIVKSTLLNQTLYGSLIFASFYFDVLHCRLL